VGKGLCAADLNVVCQKLCGWELGRDCALQCNARECLWSRTLQGLRRQLCFTRTQRGHNQFGEGHV
jgi:hypothetical protein